MNWRRDDEHVMPLDFNQMVGCVIFGDLLNHDRANHSTDGSNSVGNSHQNRCIPWCDVLKKQNIVQL